MSIALGYAAMLLVGVLLGMIGGGGSILTLPILVYLMKVPPTLASGYSLLIVGTAAVIGSWSYAKQGLIDYRTGIQFALPSFAGVFVARKFIIPALPAELGHVAGLTVTRDGMIMIVFAVVMLLAAVAMLRPQKARSSDPAPEKTGKFSALVIAEGLIVGSITGFVGAGGGFLIIPALVILVGLDMKVAVGTSLMIIAVKSLFGYIGELGNGYDIDFLMIAASIVLAGAGIFVGTRLARRIESAQLKPVFGWFVLGMGVWILGSQLL